METVLGVVLLTILLLACGLVGQQLHINQENKRRREMRLAVREYYDQQMNSWIWDKP